MYLDSKILAALFLFVVVVWLLLRAWILLDINLYEVLIFLYDHVLRLRTTFRDRCLGALIGDTLILLRYEWDVLLIFFWLFFWCLLLLLLHPFFEFAHLELWRFLGRKFFHNLEQDAHHSWEAPTCWERFLTCESPCVKQQINCHADESSELAARVYRVLV